MKVNKNTVLGDKIENKYNSAILSMGSQPKWERWISKCYNVVCDMFHSFTDWIYLFILFNEPPVCQVLC